MANSILDGWHDVARDTPADPRRFVSFRERFPVAMEDRWFPGPISHPYPGFGNCRTDAALSGHPRLPTDLPSCEDEIDTRELGIDPGVTTDDIQARGIPFPDNYSAPSYGALEEDLDIHLQVFRLGDILFTICPCEQWADQARNIKTRTNVQQGDQYLGYDWAARCSPASALSGVSSRPSWGSSSPRCASTTTCCSSRTSTRSRCAAPRSPATGSSQDTSWR
jgi:hypothetical protein